MYSIFFTIEGEKMEALKPRNNERDGWGQKRALSKTEAMEIV